MKKLILAATAALFVLVTHVRADYAPPAFGIDRTTPTASPVCLMSAGVCQVQIGTADWTTGAWSTPYTSLSGLGTGVAGALGNATNSANGFVTGAYVAPSLGITRSQIATTTISSAVNTFAMAGHSSVGDYGVGCARRRGTISGPDAVQSQDGAYWELYDDGSGVNAGCFGQTSGNSTAAIQAAVNAFNHVIISHDTIAGPITITSSNKTIDCTGAGIFAATLTTDVIQIVGTDASPVGSNFVNGCKFFPDTINGAQQTDGSYVYIKNCMRCGVSNLQFGQPNNGLFIYGNNVINIVADKVESVGPAANHIVLNGGAEIKLSHLNLYGGGACGVLASNVSGFYISDSGASNTGQGLCLHPSTGARVEFGFIVNSALGDLGAGSGVSMIAVDGSRISEIEMIGSWTSSSNVGIGTACTGSGIIKNIKIRNHRAYTNSEAAVDLGCGTYIDISGSFGNNSYTSPGTYPAIKVRSAVDHWSVKDSSFATLGQSSYVQTQGWAIVVDAGSGANYETTGNDLTGGYTVAGIADNTLGANRIVQGNIPGTWDASIPVSRGGTGAATFSAGYVKSPGSTSAFTATSTIPSADFADGNTGTGAVAHATSPAFVNAQSDKFTATADFGPSYIVPGNTSIANQTNGATAMYFDVSAGGATHGEYRFRSSNTYQTLLTLTSTAATFGGNVNVSGTLGLTAATWANNQACTAGQITVDAGYIYVCTAANTVKRAALSAF